ncbi:MAG: class I SAM-dependent methyltransferase [Deltaproteobacteria bacterium]|nr:class I SAM-dependent methyltransferase [Deltaproteobacteria bacterium]
MKLNALETLVVNNPLRARWQARVLQGLLVLHPPRRGGVVLEIGCGRGEGAFQLIPRLRPAHYLALDLDPAMLARARRRLARAGLLPRASLLLADSTRLPLPPASVDLVFGFGFLHHVPRWQAALAEVARVLRPGGAYYLEEFYPACYANPLTRRLLVHPRENRFQSPDLFRELGRAGFRLAGARDRPWWGVTAAVVKED